MRRFDDPGVAFWTGVSSKLILIDAVWLLLVGAVGVVAGVFALNLSPWFGGLVIAAAVLFAVSQLALTPRRVHAIGYALRDDDLVLRRGVLLFRMVAVPYGRMQLVDITRGPVARLFGLAELRLVTAAAATGITIPGLTEAEATALRDALVARAESRRVGL